MPGQRPRKEGPCLTPRSLPRWPRCSPRPASRWARTRAASPSLWAWCPGTRWQGAAPEILRLAMVRGFPRYYRGNLAVSPPRAGVRITVAITDGIRDNPSVPKVRRHSRQTFAPPHRARAAVTKRDTSPNGRPTGWVANGDGPSLARIHVLRFFPEGG